MTGTSFSSLKMFGPLRFIRGPLGVLTLTLRTKAHEIQFSDLQEVRTPCARVKHYVHHGNNCHVTFQLNLYYTELYFGFYSAAL